MESVVQLVVWIFAFVVANWAYRDFVREGSGGFGRLVAFWMGFPATFATRLLVRERSETDMRDDDEGLDHLVREIRRDRVRRGAEGRGMMGMEGGSGDDDR